MLNIVIKILLKGNEEITMEISLELDRVNLENANFSV